MSGPRRRQVGIDFRRQARILPQRDIAWPVHLIGAGGIGSPTLLTLAKLGFNDITVYDPDFVEPHNVPNQLLWGPRDAGKSKVDVAQARVRELTNVSVVGRYVRVNALDMQELDRPCIVVSGVDSLETRKRLWAGLRWHRNVVLYIDGRTGVGPRGQWLTVHTVRPYHYDDVEIYEKTLKGTPAVGFACDAFLPVNLAIAAVIAGQLQKFLTRQPYYRTLSLDLKHWTLVRKHLRILDETKEDPSTPGEGE